MNRLVIGMLVTAAVSFPAIAKQPTSTATDVVQHSRDVANVGDGTMSNGKDGIGLTATQRQMIAWSIAGLADMQPVPPSFQPRPGMKVPSGLSSSRIPRNIGQVAKPVGNYQYIMLNDKDLLLVKPQDGTIADVIHLNRRI